VSDLTTLAAKVPTELAERVDGLAAAQLGSVSGLIRRLLERELAAEESGPDARPVELAARMEITSWGLTASETRVAAALNLARRLDIDPTNGATHARELRLLIDDLGALSVREVGPIEICRRERS
jgi:hypothetical protein